jgi:hypothetical protein
MEEDTFIMAIAPKSQGCIITDNNSQEPAAICFRNSMVTHQAMHFGSYKLAIFVEVDITYAVFPYISLKFGKVVSDMITEAGRREFMIS